MGKKKKDKKKKKNRQPDPMLSMIESLMTGVARMRQHASMRDEVNEKIRTVLAMTIMDSLAESGSLQREVFHNAVDGDDVVLVKLDGRTITAMLVDYGERDSDGDHSLENIKVKVPSDSMRTNLVQKLMADKTSSCQNCSSSEIVPEPHTH